MNFHLQPPYEYAHLKLWFRENWSKLPQSLDTLHADFRDVRKSVKVNIASIDAFILSGERPNPTVKTYKDRLILIYEGLKITENWNLPMKTIEQKNRI